MVTLWPDLNKILRDKHNCHKVADPYRGRKYYTESDPDGGWKYHSRIAVEAVSYASTAAGFEQR